MVGPQGSPQLASKRDDLLTWWDSITPDERSSAAGSVEHTALVRKLYTIDPGASGNRFIYGLNRRGSQHESRTEDNPSPSSPDKDTSLASFYTASLDTPGASGRPELAMMCELQVTAGHRACDRPIRDALVFACDYERLRPVQQASTKRNGRPGKYDIVTVSPATWSKGDMNRGDVDKIRRHCPLMSALWDASDGECFATECGAEWDAENRAWSWVLPKWFRDLDVFTPSTYAAAVLESAITRTYLHATRGDLRVPAEKRQVPPARTTGQKVDPAADVYHTIQDVRRTSVQDYWHGLTSDERRETLAPMVKEAKGDSRSGRNGRAKGSSARREPVPAWEQVVKVLSGREPEDSLLDQLLFAPLASVSALSTSGAVADDATLSPLYSPVACSLYQKVILAVSDRQAMDRFNAMLEEEEEAQLVSRDGKKARNARVRSNSSGDDEPPSPQVPSKGGWGSDNDATSAIGQSGRARRERKKLAAARRKLAKQERVSQEQAAADAARTEDERVADAKKERRAVRKVIQTVIGTAIDNALAVIAIREEEAKRASRSTKTKRRRKKRTTSAPPPTDTVASDDAEDGTVNAGRRHAHEGEDSHPSRQRSRTGGVGGGMRRGRMAHRRSSFDHRSAEGGSVGTATPENTASRPHSDVSHATRPQHGAVGSASDRGSRSHHGAHPMSTRPFGSGQNQAGGQQSTPPHLGRSSTHASTSHAWHTAPATTSQSMQMNQSSPHLTPPAGSSTAWAQVGASQPTPVHRRASAGASNSGVAAGLSLARPASVHTSPTSAASISAFHSPSSHAAINALVSPAGTLHHPVSMQPGASHPSYLNRGRSTRPGHQDRASLGGIAGQGSIGQNSWHVSEPPLKSALSSSSMTEPTGPSVYLAGHHRGASNIDAMPGHDRGQQFRRTHHEREAANVAGGTPSEREAHSRRTRHRLGAPHPHPDKTRRTSDVPARLLENFIRPTHGLSLQSPMNPAALIFEPNLLNDPLLRDVCAARLGQEVFEFAQRVQARAVLRRAAQLDLIDKVRSVVQSLWPTATVEMFGSFSTGLQLPNGDVDVVIFNQGMNVQHMDRAVQMLSLLASKLRDRAWAQEVNLIETARVPIVTLYSETSDLHMDISVSTVRGVIHSGLVARELVRGYVARYIYLTPLVIVLKQFLYEQSLNRPYMGGLGSYSLTLMVVSLLKMKGIPEGAAGFGSPGSIKLLGSLVLDFLDLFGTKFSYATQGISVIHAAGHYRLSPQQISETTRRGLLAAGPAQFVPPSLVIDDPVDASNNLGASVFAMWRVKAALESALTALLYATRRGLGDPSVDGELLPPPVPLLTVLLQQLYLKDATRSRSV